MALTKYKLFKFDQEQARAGNLVVMVTKTFYDVQTWSASNPPTIDNVSIDDNKEKPNENFGGCGICTHTNTGSYTLTISRISYSFGQDGVGNNQNASQYRLVMGEIFDEPFKYGSVVDSSTTTTRGVDDQDNPTRGVTEESHSIVVDNLTARDQFAAQALRTLMDKIPDPAVLGDSEMNFYCNAAYQWAANMMSAAASARGEWEGNSSSEEDAEISVSELETNTEKLLNNIVTSLRKTDEEEEIGGETISSERVSIPKLIDFLNAYVADGSSTVGLKDLIDAINNISGGGGSSVTIVPYKYLNVAEAEGDGWTHSSNTWSKEGYADVSGAHTDEVAQTLPTWKNVQKISIVELPDLIQAVQNVADAITNQ